MSITELRGFLEDLIGHVTFEYNDISCGIDPISHDKYNVWYGDKTMIAESLDEAFNTVFFDDKTLMDIWNNVSGVEF